MGRSAVERAFFGKIKTLVSVPPAQQGGEPTQETREIGITFFCNALAAKSFLEIPDEIGLQPQDEDSALVVEASVRTLALVGGGTGGPASTNVAKHTRSRGFKKRGGSKTAILTTGSRTANGTLQTISFRFPSKCKAGDIADLLGQIIAPTKISPTPSATEIRPSFTIKGGMTYGLKAQGVAAATAVPAVATTQASADQLGQETKEGSGRRS